MHGHEGKLAIEVVAYGRSLVEDFGIHTYGRDPRDAAFTDFFLGTSAHNTLLVDGKSQVRQATGPKTVDAPLSCPWHRSAGCDYKGAWGDQPSTMVRSGDWNLMYYSEFDDNLLFNLHEDPGKTRDPNARQIAAALLSTARHRWSPEALLEGDARGQPLREARPDHAPADEDPPPREANGFDFSQLPGCEELLRRRGTDER